MTERKFFTFNDFIRLCKDADALISEVNSKSSTFKHLKPTSKTNMARNRDKISYGVHPQRGC